MSILSWQLVAVPSIGLKKKSINESVNVREWLLNSQLDCADYSIIIVLVRFPKQCSHNSWRRIVLSFPNHKWDPKRLMGQEGSVWNTRWCDAWVMFLSPCVVDPSLTQNPERNTHTSQELIPELQVTGVPQIHPEHKPQVRIFKRPHVQHWYWLSQKSATGSPQCQLVNVLFFNIKLPLCVA